MKRITSTHEPPTDYVILPKQLSLLKRKKTESNFIIAEYQILEKSSLVRITNISDSNLFGIEILVRGDSFENHYYVDSISKF